MANEDLIEVTVKLVSLRFPVAITMTERDYLKLLETFEYQGEQVHAVHVQTVGTSWLWLSGARVILINPDWYFYHSTEDGGSDGKGGAQNFDEV